ncbi:MAG: CHASE domain-containing protein [Pseudomonadota bacterium]|nr:CHASE domain-containing protein [Pseudomonadota bacterium]
MLVLIAATIVGFYERARLDQHLLRRVESTHGALQEQVNVTIALLRGVLGLFEASQVVEPAEFRAYVVPLSIRERYPSVLGLGYAARTDPEHGPALVGRMHAWGVEEFSIWPGVSEGENAVIVFLEPRDRGNETAIGFNMSTNAERRAAMGVARDEGRAAASGLVTLVQETEGNPKGLLIFLPHFRAGPVPRTVEERREALAGYVYAPLRVRELFEGPLRSSPDLAVRVYVGPDPVASALQLEVPPDQAWSTPVRRSLDIAGQTWTILYEPKEPDPWWLSPALPVLLTGLLFAGLLYRYQSLQLDARLRAERDAAALREEEQRYRFLADVMPQLVFTADRDGRVIYVNRRWGRTPLPGPLDAVLGDAVHPADRASIAASWAAATRSGHDWQAEVRLNRGGQQRWHLGQAVAQKRDGAVVEWVGTLTDIEAQKEAEAALQREAVELEARVAERTAELSRSNRELENFAAIASHDLQEPLRKIVAFGDRLADELGPNLGESAADSLARMRRSAQRLQQLIGDLLAFARISRAEVVPTPVDLRLLAEAVVADLRAPGGQPLDVEFRSLPIACGDPGLLRQLVENLLSNAIKFHRPDVSAHVVISAEDAGEEIDEERRSRFFRLLVEDEGIGFDPKYLDRIFQMFQRLHPRDRYEGTGIGLAICQRVAELHGGAITARVGTVRGACFVVTLPRAHTGPTKERETGA